MGDISSHKGISSEYLSKALAPISGVAKLKIKSISPIGTGQMAESYRVKFSQESGEKIESVVVKVPSQNENSRGASRTTRCYELETSFYSSLRSGLKVETPECFHVWYDAPSDDFVLVLEDIKDAKPGRSDHWGHGRTSRCGDSPVSEFACTNVGFGKAEPNRMVAEAFAQCRHWDESVIALGVCWLC